IRRLRDSIPALLPARDSPRTIHHGGTEAHNSPKTAKTPRPPRPPREDKTMVKNRQSHARPPQPFLVLGVLGVLASWRVASPPCLRASVVSIFAKECCSRHSARRSAGVIRRWPSQTARVSAPRPITSTAPSVAASARKLIVRSDATRL